MLYAVKSPGYKNVTSQTSVSKSLVRMSEMQ